jgi:hypothetical protein
MTDTKANHILVQRQAQGRVANDPIEMSVSRRALLAGDGNNDSNGNGTGHVHATTAAAGAAAESTK